MGEVAHVDETDLDAIAAVAYDAFAPFFDCLTEHADHVWWWSALMPLAQAAGLAGRRVLDVACGTGASLAPLLADGWSGAGVDVSARMLDEARRKLGPDVPLSRHDMRSLPVLGEFDLVCSLNDAVNYVLDERQLVETFKGFRRNLAPGGVVLFDLNTLWMYRNYGVLVRQQPGRVLAVEGIKDGEFAPGSTFRADFVVLEQRSGYFWTIDRIPNLQRHHPDAEIRAALAAAGLEVLGAYGQTGTAITPAFDDDRDEKVVYVARAPGGRPPDQVPQ
jgi:SAM-dependent methyltransferase